MVEHLPKPHTTWLFGVSTILRKDHYMEIALPDGWWGNFFCSGRNNSTGKRWIIEITQEEAELID